MKERLEVRIREAVYIWTVLHKGITGGFDIRQILVHGQYTSRLILIIEIECVSSPVIGGGQINPVGT